MRYCSTNNVSLQYRQISDEVKYPFADLTNAIDFAKGHREKRVIIVIPLNKDLNKLHNLHKENNNIILSFINIRDLIDYAEKYSNIEDRHYMLEQPVISWNMVSILKYNLVSDIIIAEPLVFQLDEIAKNIKNEGINVRVNPILGRHKLSKDSPMNHFFILPQHANLYNDYIDVLELNKDILCDIYIYRKEYKDNLCYLINNFDLDLHPNVIDKHFIEARLNCGQKCVISPNHCHYCYRIGQLYTRLRQIENNKN